jgi:hypothetical protein
MNITKQTFINLNKYIICAAIVLYLVGVFTPVKYLQPGLIFVFGAGFFCLLHINFFSSRLKHAAHIWLFPLITTILWYPLGLTRHPETNHNILYILTLLLSFIPVIMFMFGSSDEKPSRKERLPIVSFRTVIQTAFFMTWLSVTAFAYIRGADYYTGTRPDLFFWGMFHLSSVAVFPFLIGRVLCSWMCPNATMQDALYKNMTFKRPIQLPKAIDEQSHSASMSISGKFDKAAPLLPFTLLLMWFVIFNIETVWDLSPVIWWPCFVYMFGLMFFSLLMPWRKLCTHFCWLSSYRCLTSHNSLWRIRYNKSKCRNCKKCLAENACPFFIDICNQDNEMPATCCLCFSCMEACPFADVITFRRASEDKDRLKAGIKAA